MSAGIERWEPPNDPTAFESLCLDLWRAIWEDPNAQKNGRSGQPQAGVDVFGQHQGKWAGVQCKQKDGLLWSKVTVKELEAEVKAAKQFTPPLLEFILATTGPRDAKVQKRAREFTEEHKQQGLFSVVVWSWDDIWPELYGREDLLTRIAPTYWPRLVAVRRRGDIPIAPTRLTRGAEMLIGREDDLKRIDDVSIDSKTRILTIVAWGGVGKTSLVVEWMNRKAADGWPGFERVFDWSFYSQGTHEQGAASADSFVAEALKFFGDEAMANSPTSPWDKGAHLAQLIGAKRTLLVLDGLEPLQHPPGPLTGQLKDPAIEALLKGLARQKNPGLCIVTTQKRVADLLPFRDTTAPERNLKHLSTAAGVELLKTLGVQGTNEEFEKLVKDVTGHALTLNLMGSFLAQAFRGDIRKRDLVKFEEADAEIQGGHAFRVMEAYEKWFVTGDEKAKRQLAVLRLLGLFDRPADAGCLAALRKAPAIAKLTNPFFHRCKGLAGFFGKVQPTSESEWNLAISRLADCGLVSYSKPADAATLDVGTWTLDAHPLIRTYFAKQLREKNPEACRLAHRRLYEHLKNSTTKDRLTIKPTLEDLQPLYQAVTHGCQAGQHQAAYDEVYRSRICRDTEAGNMHYSGKCLGAFGADLGALASFFAQPWNLPWPSLQGKSRALLMGDVAYCLRALGRTTEAIEPMRAALQHDVANENWRNAAIASNNLCELELTLGDVGAAVRDAEQSIDFGDRGGNAFERLVSRARWRTPFTKRVATPTRWRASSRPRAGRPDMSRLSRCSTRCEVSSIATCFSPNLSAPRGTHLARRAFPSLPRLGPMRTSCPASSAAAKSSSGQQRYSSGRKN
jgi:hypothetical protein